jgi:Pentapeptide repeats (8 copies)
MNLTLRSPKLQRRSFRGQNLSGMDFSRVNLSGVDFTDAILDGANFSHADLRGTIFRRASLVGANLSYSRSGIPQSHELVLRVMLLIFAVSLGISAGFIGSSAAGLLTNENKLFIPFNQIKSLVPWGTISGGLGIAYSVFLVFALRLNKPIVSIMLGIGILVIMNIALSAKFLSS